MWHASQSWIHHQFIVSRSAKIAQMASYLSENALVQMISYSFYPCHSHCAFFFSWCLLDWCNLWNTMQCDRCDSRMVHCVLCWVGGLEVFPTVDNAQLRIHFHTVDSLYLACSFLFRMANLVCTMMALVLYSGFCFVCWCLFGRRKHLCEAEIVFWVDQTHLEGQSYRHG